MGTDLAFHGYFQGLLYLRFYGKVSLYHRGMLKFMVSITLRKQNIITQPSHSSKTETKKEIKAGIYYTGRKS